MFGAGHCLNWTPLYTQQLRLRHLVRIIGYNVSLEPSISDGLYYTLHLTTMCAPFYTSNKLKSEHPKWKDLEISEEQGFKSGIVIRIWQDNIKKADSILTVWGVYFSGLVYLGNKYSDMHPSCFENNTLIFQFIGGFFTSQHCLKKNANKPFPFVKELNIASMPNKSENIYRKLNTLANKTDVRNSYTMDKLLRLHSLQLSIKNTKLDTNILRDKIYEKCPIFDGCKNVPNDKQPAKQNINSLSMSVTSLSKYLHQQSRPTRFQKQEIWRCRKQIECLKFNCKLLSQEKDRQTTYLRKLNQEFNKLSDNNEIQNSLLMDRYRQLSKDLEKNREFRKIFAETREMFLHTSFYLNSRRKQLITELLDIYPIVKNSEGVFTICGVHLPDSESLPDSDETLSIALGYVTHAIQMCSIFLHVPLRYPVTHYGSRSKICDHITEKILEKDREFPLYTGGKDQIQFRYAVYLLNKNIAQLRWYCGLPTVDLRATLANLLSLLQFHNDTSYNDQRDQSTLSQPDLKRLSTPTFLNGKFKTKKSSSDNLRSLVGVDYQSDSSARSPRSLLGFQIAKENEEMKQSKIEKLSQESKQALSSHCVDCNIEQGLDLLDPRTNVLFCSTANEHSTEIQTIPINNINSRTTRSVGSYNGEEHCRNDSPNSEPVLYQQNMKFELDRPNFQEERTEFLQEWLNSGPAFVCSEENLYPEEILGTTIARNVDDATNNF